MSVSCSFLLLLVTIITLLARNQSLACKLFLLALSIKDNLLRPCLSGYSQVPNNFYPFFLLMIIMKFLSIGGGCVIISVAFYIQSNYIKRAIFFVWMPLRQLQKILYSFLYYTLQALLQLIQNTLSLGQSVVLYSFTFYPHFIYFLYTFYI